MRLSLALLAIAPVSIAATCPASPSTPTAQAYLPDAPLPTSQSGICSNDHPLTVAASSPLSLGRSYAPTKSLSIDVAVKTTTCKALPGAKVEVWMAEPSTGLYSSLSSPDNTECRGTLHTGSSGSAVINTLIPGSYGALNGLSPFSFDMVPFGPPVVHILVTADGYDPVVTEVQVPGDGVVSDWRGPSLVLGGAEGLDLTGIKVTTDGGISGSVRVVLEPLGKEDKRKGGEVLWDKLCPSMVWGSVYGFFTEPIAVCRPEMLEFFKI